MLTTTCDKFFFICENSLSQYFYRIGGWMIQQVSQTLSWSHKNSIQVKYCLAPLARRVGDRNPLIENIKEDIE